MPRPLIATIDIAALRHNFGVAKNAAPQAKAWAVVKADAYGHGLARGMRGFAAADGLALIELDGAVRLRELGWTRPILLLEGIFEAADVRVVMEYQLSIVVHCNEQIDMLAATKSSTTVDVFLKMNSGMNRLGFKPADYASAYARLRALPGIGSVTLMTHLANADHAGNVLLPVSAQMQRFAQGSAGITALRSLSNSAAVLDHPYCAHDWIRPGIMLYGGLSGEKTAQQYGLLPAMHLQSELIGLQTVPAGESIGYGSIYTASRDMRVGVVACGYADGYPRHAPNGTPVIVDGIRTTLVGRVSMDMLTVDLGPVPQARVGSKVTLWGDGLPIDEVAQSAGTIAYELMCALAPRVAVIER
jgi:alanine racemase